MIKSPRDLIMSFYGHVRAGDSKTKCLHAAQLEIRALLTKNRAFVAAVRLSR